MVVHMELYDFIISRLPDIDGYGNCNKVVDDDGVSNHSTFKQFIREDHQGDVGVFIVNNSVARKYHGYADHETDVQIVVNAVNGDIEKALGYLSNAFLNIKNNNKSNDVLVKTLRLLNLRPAGMNSAGVHWCVLNLNLKYIVAQN